MDPSMFLQKSEEIDSGSLCVFYELLKFMFEVGFN